MKNKEKKTTKQKLLIALIIVVAFLVLNVVAIYFITPIFMSRPHRNTEAEAAVSAYENVSSFTISGDVDLKGYFYDKKDTDKLLIFFGGIGEDAAENMQIIKETESIGDGNAFSCVDVAVIDWPSYGRTSGKATDKSLRKTAVDVVNAFASNSPVLKFDDGTGLGCVPSSIYAMGFSLGCGPAIYAASKCDLAGLILLAPYESAVDLFNSVTPVFHGPLKWFLGFKMPANEYAKEVSEPVLIIASETDKKVPHKSSMALADNFENYDFISIYDTSHGDIPKMPEVLKEIGEYLSR